MVITWTPPNVGIVINVEQPSFGLSAGPSPAIQLSSVTAIVQLSAANVAPRKGSHVVSELASIEVFEGSDVRFMARIVDNAGRYIDESEIEGITAHVFELSDDDTPSTDLGPITLTPVSSFYQTNGTPTTDAGWVTDTTGYNFDYTFAGETYFAEGGRRYRLEIDIDAENASGTEFGIIHLAALVFTKAILHE